MDTAHITTQDFSTDRSFRFMDLPTELRLQIAEYVLCADEPLRWAWLTSGVKEGFKSGTFKGLDSLASFTRISRQIHSETAGLLWRLNTFRFGQYVFSRNGRRTFSNPLINDHESIETAYEFFTRLAPETTIPLISAVEFHLEIRWHEDNIIQALEAIANLARGNLRAQFVLKDLLWFVPTSLWCESEYEIAQQVEHFMWKGHYIQSVLSKVRDIHFRNVQIRPDLDDEQRCTIERFLKGEELRLARAWNKYGVTIGHN